MKKQQADAAEISARKEKEDKLSKIKFKAKQMDKRKIYTLILVIALILVYLFVRRMRHSDRRPSVTPTQSNSSFSGRVDMTGREPVTLGSGTFIAGTDIPVGRYMLTTTEHDFGSVVIYEPGTKLPEISDTLGYFSDNASVPSIAVTLVENQEFVIRRLREVTFTPLLTEFRDVLTTGIWEVGLDIRPGTYTISSKDGRLGELTLYEGTPTPVGRAYLGKGENGGIKYRESDTITLKEGQTIRISHMPGVVFES